MRLTVFPLWFASRTDAVNILVAIYSVQGGFSPNIFRDKWVAYFNGPDIKPKLMGFLSEQDFFSFYEEFNPHRRNLQWIYNTQDEKYFSVKATPYLESND